jgi:hypothetical protein
LVASRAHEENRLHVARDAIRAVEPGAEEPRRCGHALLFVVKPGSRNAIRFAREI